MQLSLGLPKGSLEESTIDLFSKSGIQINVGKRSYYPTSDDTELDLVLMRPQEMPRYVNQGIIDAGITGRDWVVENAVDVIEVGEMEYSKSTRRRCRWVLAVPESSQFQKPEDLRGKRVATELVKTTSNYFKAKNIDVEVEFSWGATEVKPPRLVDAIVDITETGSSLRANNLKIIDTILETCTVFIANKSAWEEPEKRQKIENIMLLLRGTLDAEGYVGLKCNVAEGNLNKVLEILPALHNPTISHLSDRSWMAVETIIKTDQVKNIVPRLSQAGASGIVEYKINKVIP